MHSTFFFKKNPLFSIHQNDVLTCIMCILPDGGPAQRAGTPRHPVFFFFTKITPHRLPGRTCLGTLGVQGFTPRSRLSFTRGQGAFTRTPGAFTRVQGAFTRAPGVFTRVQGAFTRALDAFTRVQGAFTRAPLYQLTPKSSALLKP